MKDPMSYVERFCYKHPRFGIPNLMRYIAIGSGIVWALSLVNAEAASFMMFSAERVLAGEVWRLLTFFFMPRGFGFLAIVGIFLFYWIGTTLEQYWGTGQFSIFFFSGYLLTIFFGFVMWLAFGVDLTLTPFYLYLSMFFAFATFFPNSEVNFYFLIPIKVKYLALAGLLYYVGSGVASPFPDNLVPLVALVNYLVFCGGELVRFIRGNRTSKAAVNFRRESRRIRYEQSQKRYNHKCAVCGRTDTDFPELEFRYCSRCAGYHCFCQDHINNHVHFTEETEE